MFILKDEHPVTCDNLDEPWGHYVEFKIVQWFTARRGGGKDAWTEDPMSGPLTLLQAADNRSLLKNKFAK